MIATIALVGPDGAGKTTLAKRLVSELEQTQPATYLYMGYSPESSNRMLWTSRLSRRIAARFPTIFSDSNEPAKVRGEAINSEVNRKRRVIATIRRSVRLVTGLCEERYRWHLVKKASQAGAIVVMDRFFLTDFLRTRGGRGGLSPIDRLHYWILEHGLARPDLFVYLDVPVDELMCRRPDENPERLEEMRVLYSKVVGPTLPQFVTLDGDRPQEEILVDLLGLLDGSDPHALQMGAV